MAKKNFLIDFFKIWVSDTSYRIQSFNAIQFWQKDLKGFTKFQKYNHPFTA